MIIFILISLIQAIQFTQSINKREITCFGDSIAEGLTVLGEVSNLCKQQSNKTKNPMRFKKEGYLHQSQNEQTQNIRFKAKYSHSIQICIQNLSTQTILLSIKLSQENEEKSQQIDTQLPMNQLQPIENQLAQMKISYEIIKSMLMNLAERQELRLEQIQQLGYKIVISSLILLLLTIIITIYGTYKHKKVLINKKMI